MINETIRKIRARLESSKSLRPEKRAELMELLRQLEGEVHELDKTNPDHARSIAGYTEMSAHEATRDQQHEDLLDDAINAMKKSARGVQAAHPQLAQVVNRIATTLSNLGI